MSLQKVGSNQGSYNTGSWKGLETVYSSPPNGELRLHPQEPRCTLTPFCEAPRDSHHAASTMRFVAAGTGPG